uniref:DUF7737 domain-containing protein n=1 Tax=Actinomadura roseirufa TaxID=2094049 RepID=UPI003F9C65C6
SEAMREVDLGVAAGADPLPGDGSAAVPSAATEVRRDALARLLPDTRIAARCAIAGRHLVVRGDLRTYRIHLGTAAVTMEPGRVPLRVEPVRRQGHSGLFLPFEDERLSLILSTAFLLAADGRITDPELRRRIAAG